MYILVVFRSVSLLWSDCMAHQQMNHSWRRGSGPTGGAQFLCRVWGSLLASIRLWFLIWEPWQHSDTDPERLSVRVWLPQNALKFASASPAGLTEAGWWDLCWPLNSLPGILLSCRIGFRRCGMGPGIVHSHSRLMAPGPWTTFCEQWGAIEKGWCSHLESPNRETSCKARTERRLL